jgi:hypothetical protein
VRGGNPLNIKHDITKEDLEDLYTARGFSLYQIAAKTGIPRSTLGCMLQRYDIPTRPAGCGQKAKKGRGGDHTTKTICDTCVHAYGDDCFKVPIEDRRWVRQVQVRKMSGNVSISAIRLVSKCDRYEMGRRPLAGVGAIVGSYREFAALVYGGQAEAGEV